MYQTLFTIEDHLVQATQLALRNPLFISKSDAATLAEILSRVRNKADKARATIPESVQVEI